MSFCMLHLAYLQETRTLFLKAFSDNYMLEILSQCSALNFYPFSFSSRNIFNLVSILIWFQ